VGSTCVSGTRGFRPRRVATVGTPRGPIRRAHASRKPGGESCVDIPGVSTDFAEIVQEVSHLSEFPKGIVASPGTVNHICIGVDNYDPDALAAKCKQMGITATVNRDPNSRTSGGDQLYIQAFDNHRLQVGPHGYQG